MVISLFQLVQSLFYSVQAVELELSISFLLFSCALLTQAWGRVTYHISVKLWSMFDPFHELTPVALTSQMGRGSQRLSAMTDPFYLQHQSLHHPGQQYSYFPLSSAKHPNTVFQLTFKVRCDYSNCIAEYMFFSLLLKVIFRPTVWFWMWNCFYILTCL